MNVFYLHTYSSISYENHLCMSYRQAGEPSKFLLSFKRRFCLLNTYENICTQGHACTHTHTHKCLFDSVDWSMVLMRSKSFIQFLYEASYPCSELNSNAEPSHQLVNLYIQALILRRVKIEESTIRTITDKTTQSISAVDWYHLCHHLMDSTSPIMCDVLSLKISKQLNWYDFMWFLS